MFQVVVWPGRVGSDDFLLRERKAVPGADALVPDFEKITLKTASTFRRAKGAGAIVLARALIARLRSPEKQQEIRCLSGFG
jgi:hypothetical protein